MKKQNLKEALCLGPSTIAKMGKGENISLEVLDKTCNYFNVPLDQTAEHIAESGNEDISQIKESPQGFQS